MKKKRGGQRKPDYFSIDEAIELYNSGMSLMKVAEKLDTNYPRIRRRLLEKGVKIRKTISREDVDWGKVIEQYKSGVSLSKLSKQLNCSNTFLTNAFSDMGICVRGWRDQVYLDCQNCIDNHWYVNEEFFDSWSHEMAYVLGWIFSDGNIPQRKNIFRITSTDIEQLRNIANLFTKDATITIRQWEGKHKGNKPAGTLSVNRKSMVTKLLEYGLKPNKSNDIEFPDVPLKYFGDFLRGVFEGDGSFLLKKRKNALCPRINISTGSYNFAVGLGENIKNVTNLNYSLYESSNGVYCIEYYSAEAMRKIFDLMYINTSSKMILKRKYDKFLLYFRRNGGGEAIGSKGNKETKETTGRRRSQEEPKGDD